MSKLPGFASKNAYTQQCCSMNAATQSYAAPNITLITSATVKTNPPPSPSTTSTKPVITTTLTTSTAATATTAVLSPALTAWVRSTGYFNSTTSLNNVWKVTYSASYVYVYTNSLPSWSPIGPWKNNPNKATGQNLIAKISRIPVWAASKSATSLGPIGVLTNGVAFFNANDGQSYKNYGVWYRNALVFEGASFDGCAAHPDVSGTYHVHINPVCLYNYTSKFNSTHSPLIGFAFDGYPVYGIYAYSSANNSKSSTKRMVSSYQLRTNLVSTGRTTLYNGGPTLTGKFNSQNQILMVIIYYC